MQLRLPSSCCMQLQLEKVGNIWYAFQSFFGIFEGRMVLSLITYTMLGANRSDQIPGGPNMTLTLNLNS